MFTWTKKISNAMYEWILDASKEQSSELYHQIFNNLSNDNGGFGIEKALFCLLAVSLLAVVFYYYILAQNATSATKKNYILTWVLGYIVLVFATYLTLVNTTLGGSEVWTSPNMIFIALINIVYYTIFFELFSLLLKGGSKAPNIHLVSVFSNK